MRISILGRLMCLVLISLLFTPLVADATDPNSTELLQLMNPKEEKPFVILRTEGDKEKLDRMLREFEAFQKENSDRATAAQNRIMGTPAPFDPSFPCYPYMPKVDFDACLSQWLKKPVEQTESDKLFELQMKLKQAEINELLGNYPEQKLACMQKHGTYAEYAASIKSCSCRSGYSFDTYNQCIPSAEEDDCVNLFGIHSYKAKSGACTCEDGYFFKFSENAAACSLTKKIVPEQPKTSAVEKTNSKSLPAPDKIAPVSNSKAISPIIDDAPASADLEKKELSATSQDRPGILRRFLRIFIGWFRD